MKNLKKILLLILAAIMFTLAAPAGAVQSPFAAVTEAAAPNKVSISARKKTLTVGKSFTLKIRGSREKVKWSTSNKKVAAVSSKGRVTAKKVGTATITARVGGKKYTCRVTVKKASAAATYILNTNTLKFHRPSCYSCDQIAPENRKVFKGTREEVIAMGYDPCKRCNP